MSPTATQHIEIRTNRRGLERAYIAGTRVRVQDIVSDHERHGLTPDEIVREYPHLGHAQVHAALAYYFEHQQEIRGHMREDAAFAESLRAAPAPVSVETDPTSTDANRDSVSP